MRVAAVVSILGLSATSALALDVSKLPDSCKVVIEASKADKPQFAEMTAVMIRARKANDNASFCNATQGYLALLAGEQDKVDQCVGELAVDKSAAPDTVGQFAQARESYRKMIAAARQLANDRMRCGLSD